MAETPQSCESHQGDYKEKAWEMYSLDELGGIVHFFTKRSKHRKHLGKREKDLTDAQNYLNMMQSKLTEEKETFLVLKRKANAEQRRLKAINEAEEQRRGSGPGW